MPALHGEWYGRTPFWAESSIEKIVLASDSDLGNCSYSCCPSTSHAVCIKLPEVGYIFTSPQMREVGSENVSNFACVHLTKK